jgi:hypothetical protein
MRHRFTPRTSVEKSDWHTWSPAPTPRLLQQGRGLPHCSLSPRWGMGQGEGKNMPATARQAPRDRAWRPETFRSCRERSGESGGVEDGPNRGSRVEVEVNRKWSEAKVTRFKTSGVWRDTAQHRTHPLHPLGGHVLAHHLRHLGMSHHAQRAGQDDRGSCDDREVSQGCPT